MTQSIVFIKLEDDPPTARKNINKHFPPIFTTVKNNKHKIYNLW